MAGGCLTGLPGGGHRGHRGLGTLPDPTPRLADQRRDGPQGRLRHRSRLVDQRGGQDLVHVVDRHDRELLAHVVRHVHQVPLVAARDDHRLHARQVGRQQLGLQAADGQHPPAQRDLAGHGDVTAHRASGEQAGHGGGHGHPGRGAVLGGRPRRNVDVEGLLLEDHGVEPQLAAAGADVGQARPGRLLHDAPQLAGEDEVVLAVHLRGLDLHDVAAGIGHDQAGHDTDLVLLLQLAVVEAGRTDVLLEVVGLDLDLGPGVGGHLAGDLAGDRGDLALDVPDAGLTGEGLDHPDQGPLLEGQLLGRQPVVLELLGDQELLGDPQLLELGVARQRDDLHPVAEGRWDAVAMFAVAMNSTLDRSNGTSR